jgi:hypothetical protein
MQMRALKGLAFLLVLCAMSVPAWATTVFSLDNGTCTDTAMTNWQTSQLMWLNAFNTGGQTMDIDQMSVAFPNNLPAYQGLTLSPTITPGTTVYMDLYADNSGQAGNPGLAGVTLLYETSFTYPTSNFPDSSTFLSVSVPNVPVTGSFFVGVTALAREDLDLNQYDEDAVSLSPGDSSKSWAIFKAQGDTSDIDRTTLINNANVWPYTTWMTSGVNMIRAEGVAPVPEPITMTSLLLALGGLGAWVRRRARQEA